MRDAAVNPKRCTPDVAAALAGYIDARLGRPNAQAYAEKTTAYQAGYSDGLAVAARLAAGTKETT